MRSSAFFLVVVNLGGAAASLFALGYGRHEDAPQRVLPFYPAFLAGMNLVVLADDAFTLPGRPGSSCRCPPGRWSWRIIATRDNVARRLRLSGDGELRHARAAARLRPAGRARRRLRLRGDPRRATRRPGSPALVLVLALVGAGSKAGLVPLHVWLPLAHPAAPSHVSALMSGVMTKVAVYGFVRIVFDLLGPPAWWWSMVVLALGGVTAVMGVLYALMQHDLKRLLAYHTVENIGIIFIGLGLALAFKAHGMAGGGGARADRRRCSTCFNHSLFKSLLFFGAGAVLTATGERDMEQLGGLIHRMPQTAFAFLVGCVAISALPPLNGFVSEWLTFQAILLSPQLPSWGLKLLVPGGRRAAGAVGGARRRLLRQGLRRHLPRPAAHAAPPRSAQRDRPLLARRDVRPRGALPGRRRPAGPRSSTRWRRSVAGAGRRADAGADRRRTGSRSCRSRRAAAPITACWSSCSSSISGTLAAFAIHRLASDRLRRAPAWDCGYPDPSPATQYTADSFAQPIRRVFGTVVFRAREHVEMPPPGDMRPARLDGRAARSRLGRALCADRRRRRLRGRPAQPPAVPHHPPLSQPGLRRPRRPAPGARDMALILDSRRAGRADAAGAAAGAAAHRLRAQGEGAAAAPAGARRCSSPIATSRGCCARRWCWRRTPPGCSASSPI